MNRQFSNVTLAIGGLVLLLIIVVSMSTLTIEAGEEGVLFNRFTGLEKDKTYSQGFHVIAPWNDMYIYDVRVQSATSNMQVLSKNGLTIKLEVSYWYKPNVEQLGYLHDEVGVNFHDKIVIPSIRSATREVIGKYLPEELYSSKREVIEDEIYAQTIASISDKYIQLDDVLIRDVELPVSLQQAIEKKLKQEQASLEYEFRLQQAEKEKERLKIEAEGKAQANRIVSASITDKILKEKGIEATLRLSESSNSKVIVIGSGKDGLPIILNSEK